MTIADVREKCKNFVAKAPRDVLIIGILILASSTSFWFGYLAGLDAEQEGILRIEQALTSEAPTQPVGAGSVGVVASRNGTKYYLSGCAGADRISDANKVWFASPAAAAAAGYTPAANCKGL